MITRCLKLMVHSLWSQSMHQNTQERMALCGFHLLIVSSYSQSHFTIQTALTRHVSESGSDIFSKREVIQKLRQQLKRRDDMIIEMQDQIMELQNSINSQMAISTSLQSQLDAANKDLLDSEREIQRLRKAIADHCLKHANGDGKPSVVAAWPPEVRNGHGNGYSDAESTYDFPEKGRIDGEKVEMLKREVGELKEVLEGKEYLLQNYKEQKSELSVKIKELQQRLDSQLPNIL
ncbi:unnamed protein product [Linum trigynum]|uniref:Uncharacterized protein n=2 Tax=Linum trigynum TaxID=586398 RepID=A0AAV2ESR7_9ROSI